MTPEATETTIAHSFTRKERQRILRDHLVRSKRTYNEAKATERGLQGQTQNPYAQDAAPDWAWKLVDAIFERTLAEPDLGIGLATRAVAWCEQGDRVLRSEHLRELIRMWIGPRGDMLRLFLASAEKTKGGATGHLPTFWKKRALRAVSITLDARDANGENARHVQIDARGEPLAIRDLVNAARTGMMNGYLAGTNPHPPPEALFPRTPGRVTVSSLPTEHSVTINDLSQQPPRVP